MGSKIASWCFSGLGCGAAPNGLTPAQLPTVVTYPPVPVVEKPRECSKPPYDDFNLAQCYHTGMADGRTKIAISRLALLVNEYPKSTFAPAALIAIAEYYFSHNLLLAARKQYEKALKTSAVEVHPRALYALGHIHFIHRDFDKAQRAFERFRTEFPKESRLACQPTGDVLACGYLGFVAARGITGPKDQARASKLYQAVCRGTWGRDGPRDGFYIGSSGKPRGLFHAYCNAQP